MADPFDPPGYAEAMRAANAADGEWAEQDAANAAQETERLLKEARELKERWGAQLGGSRSDEAEPEQETEASLWEQASRIDPVKDPEGAAALQAKIIEASKGPKQPHIAGAFVPGERDKAHAMLTARAEAKHRASATRDVDGAIEDASKEAARLGRVTLKDPAAVAAAWERVAELNQRREKLIETTYERRSAEGMAQRFGVAMQLEAARQGYPSTALPALQPQPTDTVPEKKTYSVAELNQIMKTDPKRGWEIGHAGRVRFPNLGK